MNVLMVGVDESTKGGMWTVVENYLNDKEFVKNNGLIYVPTSITGCANYKKILFTINSFVKIRKIFSEKNIDIVHAHMSERSSITRKGIVMKYAKKHGAKIVLHMHGAEFEVLYKQMPERKKKSVRNVLNLADRIIILGEYWKEFISSLVNDASKVQVAYNAVTVPSEYSYDTNSSSILFLGAVTKRKGIPDLLDALVRRQDVLKNSCIIDIWGPDTDGNIVDEIRIRELSEWVKYHGWLVNDDKKEILKHTAINVLPSYNEGLPMTILEAMSYGIPSITTDVAAIPEAVNNNNGIIIKPGDVDALAESIVILMGNDELRKKLSRQAYEDAKNKFSVENHISLISKIYEELA